MTGLKLRSVEELDALPDQAVVYDDENRVWQKWPYRVSGGAWFTPGVKDPFPPSEVALPARLLDDGL